MEKFRSEDLISLGDIVIAVATALFLLFIAYVILKKYRPAILGGINNINREKNIKLIERAHIPKLGDVYVISIKNEEFVVVHSKNSTSICPLYKKRSENESTNITSEEC